MSFLLRAFVTFERLDVPILLKIKSSFLLINTEELKKLVYLLTFKLSSNSNRIP